MLDMLLDPEADTEPEIDWLDDDDDDALVTADDDVAACPCTSAIICKATARGKTRQISCERDSWIIGHVAYHPKNGYTQPLLTDTHV